ncbi:MAG: hypothetical protein SOT68_10130 [Oscillospiraceae bacterium]|nr:hypothetical protein [Oscillospiraceae bacterium]MDD7279182.1 hypothetical protein [Oscillospiraceae bacterium]MDY2864530.1 hypothetical protein [Oscillospiraceae bacterium]
MDELKMDGLELPDTGETYDDLPDASEGLEETAQEATRPSDSMDNFDDIAMPVLSEMDGSDIASPSEQAAKSASPDKPVQPKPMFEDMSAPAKSQSTSQTTSQSSYTYQSTSSTSQGTTGTYQSVYSSTSSSRTSSMNDVYAARMAVDPEKYEKGRRKTRILGGIGIAVYGFNTLTYLLSVFGGVTLSGLLDLALSAVLLYLFIKFFKGSDGAKNTIATIVGIDIVFSILGLIQAGIATVALSGLGLGAIGGLIMILGVITLVIRGVMLYFLVLDDDISEYSKNKQ